MLLHPRGTAWWPACSGMGAVALDPHLACADGRTLEFCSEWRMSGRTAGDEEAEDGE